MMAQIKAAVERKIRATKPTLIACSDPVALGLFMNWDQRSATIDKTRGGVYDYDGIKVIIVTPITAINRQFDERMLKDDDGEDIQSEPYRIKNGALILSRDWEKVGRYYQGKQRRLPPFEYSVTRTIDDLFAARDWLLQRSEEHTSELQSLMRISYAVFCLKTKHKTTTRN